MKAITNLEAHLTALGLDYPLFVRMAEANWNEKKGQYEGIRTMARILGTTDVSISKYLKIYDKGIGRVRNEQNKQTN